MGMITRKAEEVRHKIATIIASVLDDLLSLGFTSDLWTSRALCNSNIPGIPDPGNSQDFPGIPASNSRPKSREWNFSLSFPFPKMGMEFSFPFPFPKIVLEFSTWIPVPEKWEWNLPFPVPVPEVQKSFPLMAVTRLCREGVAIIAGEQDILLNSKQEFLQ